MMPCLLLALLHPKAYDGGGQFGPVPGAGALGPGVRVDKDWWDRKEWRIIRNTGTSETLAHCFHMTSPVANIISCAGWSGFLLIQLFPQILSLSKFDSQFRLGRWEAPQVGGDVVPAHGNNKVLRDTSHYTD